jgi:ankyrin repeat protein
MTIGRDENCNVYEDERAIMKVNKLIWMALAILLGVGTGMAGAATNEVSALLQQGLFEEEANQNLDAAIQAYQSVIAQTEKNRQFAATAIFRLGECYRKQGKTNEAGAQYQRILRDFADQPELAKLSRQYLAGFGVAAPAAMSADNSDAILWNKVKDLAPTELEKVLPTLAPDPVLTSLLQQRNAAETSLAQSKLNEGERNPDLIANQAVLDTINKQLSEKIGGIMAALQLRAEISAPGTSAAPGVSEAALQTQKQLLNEEIKVAEEQVQYEQKRIAMGVQTPTDLAQSQEKVLELKRQRAALDSGQPYSPQATPEPSNEDKELQRLQTMIKDNPDLINGQSGNNVPLIDAAIGNHLAVAKFLLDNGADVNIRRQSDGRTALNEAAELGFKEMAELLLDHGADVNETGPNYTDRMPPLILAAKHGFKAVAEVLLAHKADVNVKAPGGETPLHVAVANGFMAVAELLLSHGADINARTAAGQTPLHLAATAGTTTVIGWLIAHKAEVDARDNYGLTPLFAAAQAGQIDAASLLLKNKADVNAQANGGTRDFGTGWAPLHVAIAKNYGGLDEMVKLLLENNARTDAQIPVYAFDFGQNRGYVFRHPGGNQLGDAENIAPLGMAVMTGQQEVVRLLIEHHADVNAKDTAGESPLILAAAIDHGNGAGGENRDRLGIAELLLAGGADVNAQDNEYASALSLAVYNNSPAMVKLILARKPKVDILDKDGCTPLQRTLQQQRADIAAMLLDAGANPDAKYPKSSGSWTGLSAIEVAVITANKPMVQLLLAHKANPNAQDDSGETPLSRAKVLESDPAHARLMGEIVDLLRSAGANENLRRLSTIGVSRAGADYAGADYTQTVFLKGTNSFNHYSLFQLLTAFYAPPIKTSFNSPSVLPGLAFPDFGKISISRLQKDGKIKLIPVDLETLLMAGDCSQDVPLEWGDVVEIPESDHKVGEAWTGLAEKERQTLWKCLGGKVAIVVKGQTNLVELTLRFFHPSERGLADAYSYNIHYPAGFDKPHGAIYQMFPELPKGPWSFWLYDVVDAANVILTSSDLSRVKVTRFDAASRKPVQMVFDLEKKDPKNDLWLRDGDVIELPEKP